MVFFDEEDIRQELVEMGYTPSRKLIEDLRSAIARADQHRVEDENYESEHSFLGLTIDERQPPREEGRRGNVEQSPLVMRSSRARNPLRWQPQIPQPIDTITFVSPQLDGLMEDAYRSIQKTYAMVDEMEDMKTELEEMDLEAMMERADREARRAISDDSASTARDVDEREEGERKGMVNEELKKGVDKSRDRRIGARKHSSSSAADGESATGRSMEGVETLPGAQGLEGGVRPVLVPAPGRRPFRFDPVNRIGIYQQEWKRLPAPGEKKRLSLRWKIREQLLHREVPHFDRSEADQPAARLQIPPLQHPKDWSPRPYLD